MLDFIIYANGEPYTIFNGSLQEVTEYVENLNIDTSVTFTFEEYDRDIEGE